MDISKLLNLSADVSESTYRNALDAYRVDAAKVRTVEAGRTDEGARTLQSRKRTITGRKESKTAGEALPALILVCANERARREHSTNWRDAFATETAMRTWVDRDDATTQLSDLAGEALTGKPHALAAIMLRTIRPDCYQSAQTFEGKGWNEETPTANGCIADPSARAKRNAEEYGYRLPNPVCFKTVNKRHTIPGPKPVCLPPVWNTVTPSGGIIKRSNADRGRRTIEACNDAVLALTREHEDRRHAAETAEWNARQTILAEWQSAHIGDAEDCHAAMDAMRDIDDDDE